MSYCVNCGVELDKTAVCCALCNTKVINPNQEADTQSPAPYPQNVNMLGAADRRYTALLITLMWALPSAVCVIVNLLFYTSGFWAAYPVAGLTLIWICIILPVLFREVSEYWFLAIDTCAVILYLWLIETLGPTHGWWVAVALPITLCAAVLALMLIALARKKMHPLHLWCIGMLAPGILSIVIEAFCLLYGTGSVVLRWSVIVSVVCVSVSIMFFVVGRNKRVMEALQKRMHI